MARLDWKINEIPEEVNTTLWYSPEAIAKQTMTTQVNFITGLLSKEQG